MEITIKYKNGHMITNNINYLHFENGNIYFTVLRNPTPVFDAPVKIPLENIESYTVSK